MTEKVKIAINGFGRIGKLVFRVLENDELFEVVAINDLAKADTLAHLLKYDTVHGKFDGHVAVEEGNLIVNGRTVRVCCEKDPAALPWKELGIYFVVESTGVFRHREKCMKHVTAGAKKVLLTVPAKDEIDATVVLGVNDDDLKAEHQIISNASCTTNCLAPVVKVLHDSFGGLSRGLMTTVHAYTNDQNTADQIHSDLRRARAAAANIIPTTTGAAKAVGKVIPELNGKLNGMAMRVPVTNGSCIDLVAEVAQETTVEAVNAAMKAASEGAMKGLLSYTEDPIVSSDIIHDPSSSIFDAKSTMVMGNLIKVVSWYDNEWGYSNRVVDLMKKSFKLDS